MKLYPNKRPRKGNRRTNSQWRAIGWNYQPVMPSDMWLDIGAPEPSPRIFGFPDWLLD